MDKVKLILTYTIATLYQDRLENIYNEYSHNDPKVNKMFAAMWVRVYLKLKAKTSMKFEGEKKFSLDLEHAIAFEILLRQWIKTDEINPDERAAFRLNAFRSTADFIDQKTA